MITYNDFEKYLTKIQRIHELEDKILNLGDEYSDLVLEYVSPFAYHGVTMEDELIDCLEKGLNLTQYDIQVSPYSSGLRFKPFGFGRQIVVKEIQL